MGLSDQFGTVVAAPPGNQRLDPLPPGSVRILDVSKSFRKQSVIRSSYSTLKTGLIRGFSARRQAREHCVTALRDITVKVAPGCALGVIGRNGSGKSTLLKLIAGIYRPDQGTVDVCGRISALIELGAGFHPDFTGRENIYLGGVMYGLSRREIDERFYDIVRYAELEDFIEEPVRTYSSGMYMRLGFSLAVHTDPDILLVDEVLAVGDAAFIHRCQETISEFRRRGKTLIFVTHDLSAVSRWCDDAIWLEKGRVAKRGDPRWVIDCYLQAVKEQEQAELIADNVARKEGAGEGDVEPFALHEDITEESSDGHRWGNRDVEISAVRMKGASGEEKWLFSDEESVEVEVSFTVHKPVKDLVFGIGILRADGLCVLGTNTDIEEIGLANEGGTARGDRALEAGQTIEPVSGVYSYRMPRLGLVEDTYYLDVAAHHRDGTPFDYHHRLYKFSVRGKYRYQGVVVPAHSWKVELGDGRQGK